MGRVNRRIGKSSETANVTADGTGGGVLNAFIHDYFNRSGNVYNAPGAAPTGIVATGGVISDYVTGPGDIYRAHVFTSSGTFAVSAIGDLGASVEYLVVAGGGGGGGGYYGGGGGAQIGSSYGGQGNGIDGGGAGGGSSYYGHPQITSGSTCAATLTESSESGGAGKPNYVACTSEGRESASAGNGEDGYVLITGSVCSAQSTTIVSTAFTAGSVPTTSRIVVFEENIETPTLNTDVIASISRDGGSTFTNATLSDSGYVTGSSGQRILTGQATISGQPSGQSMRWKLALANKKVKIHGVSLAWA